MRLPMLPSMLISILNASRCWRGLALALLFIASLVLLRPAWSATAVCRAANGGEHIELPVPASVDPFEFHSAEFAHRFRVSAQYLQPPGKLKTYVYDFRAEKIGKPAAVLIHAAEYRLSDADCREHADGFGLNKVYSRNYEREIFLQCFAVCD